MELEMLGMPKAKITQFNKKGIHCIEDLARFFPRKYYDFRIVTPILDAKDGEVVAIVGKIEELRLKNKLVRAKIRDEHGSRMFVSWFHQAYLMKRLREGETYIFCGKVQVNPDFALKQMTNPFYFGEKISEYQRIVPVYSKIAGMSEEYLIRSIQSALAIADKSDYLEPVLLSKFKIPKVSRALRAMHEPKDDNDLKLAKKRFVFDDLFLYQMQLMERNQQVKGNTKYLMPTCKTIESFMTSLPFDLTDGQRETLRGIYLQMRRGKQVNALVQGDVGSGKTVVAFILMLIAAENGFQSALMAPTTVLAKQHYQDLVAKTSGMGYRIGFLSGDMKVKEKRNVLRGLESGDIHMVVGTHAVLQKDVRFQNLALTVVDEEHRFGVVQRNGISEKSKQGVHQVTMSATPIPRTLAMTIYGESIDVYTITTMPKGRKPIITVQVRQEEKAYDAMYRQIQEGRQCYVVCPLIEDSDSDALADVDSVEATYEKMVKYFTKYPEVQISMISGKMKLTDITTEIDRFAKNDVQILISTTIIEVGVNVPNASVMLIKNAERFGLSQLHQLRGRVGRGQEQSYCVLLSAIKDNPKLQAMCETTDGFKIAEKDLELRGAGDFIGTEQSGHNKYIMLMLSYPLFFEKIKEEVKQIYSEKARLSKYNWMNDVETWDRMSG